MSSFEEVTRMDSDAAFQKWVDEAHIVRDLFSHKLCWDAAWDAATFEANNWAGDSANEGEKDARRKVAIEKIGDRIQTGELANLNADVDAIIKEAQG